MFEQKQAGGYGYVFSNTVYFSSELLMYLVWGYIMKHTSDEVLKLRERIKPTDFEVFLKSNDSNRDFNSERERFLTNLGE